MVYRVIGLMSGSSLDGLDIAFTELDDSGGKWAYNITHADCIAYSAEWVEKLQGAKLLNAFDYLVLHAEYGRYIGGAVNSFIEANNLHHQVQLIASHGHTVFHAPGSGMTAQLGDGATIAAVTGINVVSDLRAMDVALGGQGAPIVPVGEKLLWNDTKYFLNVGGIANVSFNKEGMFTAFDVCPANRVLNMLAQLAGKPFDEDGDIAKTGNVDIDLLVQLNRQEYYRQAPPKSLANEFGTDVLYPIIMNANLPVEDALRTYVEHIAEQVTGAFYDMEAGKGKLLVTGGGAFNGFLIERLQNMLAPLAVEVTVPGKNVVQYKEALVMALLGLLRWREENTVMSSVTGATRDSIGGAVWMGLEA
ncbi:MAG TPA: anhydro-N-acetylmuramic acid kinase [Chitinophagaceae bacterium]|nr:anhydro-N-acetylmuramic acid kinase [Chitinophagaceae bacterium]